jgi:hypothetical protein
MAADARRRAEEYLANRIFRLQWAKCTAHSHFLCAPCAADWIIADKADALAQETERCIRVIRETVGETVPTELLVAKIRGTRP